jgi:hypothetical protein
MMVVQNWGKEPKNIDFRHAPQSASTSVTQTHHGCVEGASFEAFMNKNAKLAQAEQNLWNCCAQIYSVQQQAVAVCQDAQGCQKQQQSHHFPAVKTAERGHVLQ